ncbi:hypothetical protein J6590_059463 [Homalodisca vitripennis]|nr:hypothetical protein J6590_059463 [Homalodisca vitripennis]
MLLLTLPNNMKANIGTSQGNSLPDYVNFLLSPGIPLDFHIIVGNPDLKNQERIGVMKWMLIARSKVLRVMLYESKMKHDKEMTITDLDSSTLKNFLVYMYGHDHTSSLEVEAAVPLLYAAEKYDVTDLKYKLGDVITSRLTTDNVFVVLERGYVCEKVPKLWEAVNKIIHYYTDQLFIHPKFPNISPTVLLYIVQQDGLAVGELDIWRAVLNWASHQAQPVAGIVSAENLRLTILPFLKHIHFSTFSAEDLDNVVMATGILMNDINLPVAGKTESHNSDTEMRKLFSYLKPFHEKEGLVVETTNVGVLHLQPTEDMELCALECKSSQAIPNKVMEKGETLQYDIKLKISHTPNIYSFHKQSPVEIRCVEVVQNDSFFVIEIKNRDRFVVLKANEEYTIELFSTRNIQVVRSERLPDLICQSTDSLVTKFLFQSPVWRVFYNTI